MNTIQMTPIATKPTVKYGRVNGRVMGYSKKDAIVEMVLLQPDSGGYDGEATRDHTFEPQKPIESLL